jgi:signal transduction histidine kinase
LQRRIDGLPAHAAVLDEHGAILAVNRAWRAFARRNGLRDADAGVGTSYVRVCEARDARETEGPAVAHAIRRVLRGAEEPYRRAYSCHGPARASWFQVEVASLRYCGRLGALVTHVPVEETVYRQAIADEERRHIARELHDSTAQNLAMAVLDLEALAKRDRGVSGVVDTRLEEALDLCRRSLGEVRSLSYEIAPPGFQPGKLVESLKRLGMTFARRTGIAVMMCAAAVTFDDDELSRERSEAIYRTVEESLHNVRRHAHGSHVALLVRRSEDGMTVEVVDDGKGMAPDARPGKGITDMRDRIETVGGRLEISTAASGTVVRAVVPVEGEGDAVDRHRG